MSVSNESFDVNALAQEIRRVDGNHKLGAGALAEALMPFLSAALSVQPAAAVVGEPEEWQRWVDDFGWQRVNDEDLPHYRDKGVRLRALYAAPSAPDGWQPIETAPKDGTNIQVWAEGYEWPEVVRYELYDPEDAEEIGMPGYWRYSEEMLADVANVEDEAVTHWRSLPPPPAPGEKP